MKRITFSLMAILTVASLNLPAFAANQNVNVLQNPMLIDTAGIAAFSAGNQSSDRANIRRDVVQNPMLVDTAGIAAFSTRNQRSDENYGLAPAWEGRESDSRGMKIDNQSAYVLPGINDNTN
jgi:hypothetical protein